LLTRPGDSEMTFAVPSQAATRLPRSMTTPPTNIPWC